MRTAAQFQHGESSKLACCKGTRKQARRARNQLLDALLDAVRSESRFQSFSQPHVPTLTAFGAAAALHLGILISQPARRRESPQPEIDSKTMLSLWSMIKVCLLGCNAIAILNRPRFLDKVEARCSNEMATQAVNFAKAAQYLRPILIPLNIVCIFVEMLFGA